MLCFYGELPVIHEYCLKVRALDVRGFITQKAIEEAGLTATVVTEDGGFWSDPGEIQVYDLDDVFPLIVECGWEYKSTYWRGGSLGNAHRVLCFTKLVED